MLGQAVGFDLRFRQLDKGNPSIPAIALLGKNITLVRMQFGCGYHQLGLPPAKQLTFGVPVSGLSSWFGREYSRSHILPFNHSGGIDGVSGAGFEAITVSFSEDYLSEIAGSFRITVPELLLDPSPESTIARSEANHHFRKLLSKLFFDKEYWLEQELEDELAITLLHAAQNTSAAEDRSSSNLRTRALDRALAYLEGHQDQVVTVRDICVENGIALRTLNRAFNERFGIGSKAYMKRWRLSAVRTGLLRSPPESLVTDIANHWGFWHLGQFANDYSNLFGELPSETNKKSPLESQGSE